MQDHIRTALALQHAPASLPFVKLPEGARVKDMGIEYNVLHCDRNGAALRRMDETNATITFTQADLNERLNREANPMTVEFRYYSENKAKVRLKGTSSLSVLADKDQEEIREREYFVRKFLELKAQNREERRLARIKGLPLPPSVSKSRESLLRVIPIMARAWRELRITSGAAFANRKPTKTGRVNAKTRARVDLYEPCPSSVKGWILAMEENEFDPLCLKNNYRTERPEYFAPDEFQYLNDAVRAACSTTKPDLAEIHRGMVGLMEAANKLRAPADQLRIPCEDTLRNRYNALPEMWRELGRDGRETARKEWQPEHGGIDVVRALERIECDDHEIDLQTLLVKIGIWQTLSKAERKRIKRIRLWITAMICVATRCIIALHVSAEPPSLKSAMTALEMSTRDKTDIARRLGCQSPWMQHGTGETIAVDSAVYFAHRPYRIAVNDMGYDIFLPPAGQASMRGYIERWFQTCSHQMFNYFDGRTWGSIAEKGDYDSEAHAASVADQIAECLIRWAVDGYHNAPHEGLNGATPLNRWLELARDHGVQPGPTGALRSHLFGTYVKRVISKKGLRVAGLYFQSKELQQIRRKSKKTPVLGRVNNHNLDAVSVLTENGWIEVPCVHRELAGVSIWRWLATVERLKLFNSENAKASRQILVDTFAWLKQQAEMARLEAGLVNPVLTDEDYQRFERKMDREFDLIDVKGEPVPEGEWRPSNELFAALRIAPIVYARTRSAKVIREEAETGGRPPLGTALPPPPPQEAKTQNGDDDDDEATVIRRISNDIFDDE